MEDTITLDGIEYEVTFGERVEYDITQDIPKWITKLHDWNLHMIKLNETYSVQFRIQTRNCEIL